MLGVCVCVDYTYLPLVGLGDGFLAVAKSSSSSSIESAKLVLERALVSLAYGDCTPLSLTHSWNCLSPLYWFKLASPAAVRNGLLEE